MKIQEVQKIETKTVTISIRTYPSKSKWMRENKVSPNAIFDIALNELMKENK